MIRALVLSDSHRDAITLAQILRLHPEANAVFFLGDGERDFESPTVAALCEGKIITAVAGNNDFSSRLPTEQLVPLGGKRILALHGHTRYVKYDMQGLIDAAREQKADIVLYGHTHVPKIERIDGVYYMCPGSVRGGAYGMLDITDKGEIMCIEAKV